MCVDLSFVLRHSCIGMFCANENEPAKMKSEHMLAAKSNSEYTK